MDSDSVESQGMVSPPDFDLLGLHGSTYELSIGLFQITNCLPSSKRLRFSASSFGRMSPKGYVLNSFVLSLAIIYVNPTLVPLAAPRQACLGHCEFYA